MKAAIVTGSAKGLGRAIAVELSKQGFAVCINYRTSASDAKETLQLVREHSPDSILVQGDMSLEADVQRLVSTVIEKFKRIDILVNNAGDFIFKRLSESSESEFRNVMDSNLTSSFLCSKAVLPYMRSKKSGSIINIGCAGCDALLPRPMTTPYYIAKSGILMLTRQLAEDEWPNGIRINMISPGVLDSSVARPSNIFPDQVIAAPDIINALRFLLSEESAKISGSNLEVSAGWRPR